MVLNIKNQQRRSKINKCKGKLKHHYGRSALSLQFSSVYVRQKAILFHPRCDAHQHNLWSSQLAVSFSGRDCGAVQSVVQCGVEKTIKQAECELCIHVICI